MDTNELSTNIFLHNRKLFAHAFIVQVIFQGWRIGFKRII